MFTGISVVGYHQEAVNALKNITFYHIQVLCEDGTSYLINRRFSQILRLHKQLARQTTLFPALPAKPPKYATRLTQNEEFVGRRMDDLNVYFQQLLNVDLITTHDGFLQFFSN